MSFSGTKGIYMTDTTEKTIAEKLWSEIKAKYIDLFGLPNQVIEMHASPITVEPTKLYLMIKSSAVLPALEMALAPSYKVEQLDRYVVISKNAK